MSQISQPPVTMLYRFNLSDPSARNEAIAKKRDSNEHSSPETLEGPSQDDTPYKSQKTQELQAKIHKVQIAQEQLDEKFHKVLEHLTSQIGKKEEANTLLEREINFLRNFLRESREDLNVIKTYLRRQQQRDSCKENNRKTPNLNETVSKGSRLAGRKQIFTDITVESMVTSRKSISPRMKLLKKTIEG